MSSVCPVNGCPGAGQPADARASATRTLFGRSLTPEDPTTPYAPTGCPQPRAAPRLSCNPNAYTGTTNRAQPHGATRGPCLQLYARRARMQLKTQRPARGRASARTFQLLSVVRPGVLHLFQTNTLGKAANRTCSPVARSRSLIAYSTLPLCGCVVVSNASVHVTTVPSSLTSSSEAIQPRVLPAGSFNRSRSTGRVMMPSGSESFATDAQSNPTPPLPHLTILKKT